MILSAANQSIPKSKGSTRNKHTPWWNDDCEEATKEYKEALYKCKKLNSEENKINFKRLKSPNEQSKKQKSNHG